VKIHWSVQAIYLKKYLEVIKLNLEFLNPDYEILI